MSTSTVRSWKMLLPLAAVLLLALLWTVYWILASGIVKARFAEERSTFAARGLTLTCGTEIWGGYPFHFEFTCSSPVLVMAGRMEATSSELLLTALAYAPWQIVALLDGPSTFSGPGIRSTTAEHQRAIATFTFDCDWKLSLSAEVPALSISGHSAAQVMLHTRPSRVGLMDLAVSAKEMIFQSSGKPALPISEGEVLGTLLPDNSMKVDRLSLQHDEVRFWGAGSAGLDGTNRPSGKLEMQTNDLDALLALLDPYLGLPGDKKAGVRALLGLLGSEAKAPLIAKDGVLYLGPFKITEILPLY
jgi:hypothetical protein